MAEDLTGVFKPEAKTIKKIFGDMDSYYRVPDYQRPYSWGSEQIEQLFDDLFDAFNDSENPSKTSYFLGPIILIKTKDDFEIVDGQQRLTTLTILFCVLRDLYLKDDDIIINSIRSVTGKKNYRLRLVTQFDQQNKFEKEILEKVKLPTKELSTAEREKDKFTNAVLIFKERLDKLTEEKRRQLTDFILDNAVMITITCSNKSYAIKLFQVLNSRGLDLYPSDLIKSYLYGKCAEDKRGQFTSSWRQIEEICSNVEEDLTDMFTVYEYYLLASNPKKSLYDELEAKFKSEDPNTAIYKFKNFVDAFKGIYTSDSKIIYSFYYLPNQVFWKAVLTTARVENLEPFEDFCKDVSRMYYLYWIGGYTSSKVKQITFNIIEWIKQKKTINYIEDGIAKKLVEDDVISRARRNLDNDAYDESWLKPLLVLTEYDQTDSSKIAFIELNNKLHVDHILPKKWSSVKEWKELWTEEQAKKWVNRIGNLTLLSGRKNISQQNDPPSKKKEMYEKGYGGKTSFEISKQVIEVFKKDGWQPKNAEDRQELLMKKISTLLTI